MAWVQVTTKGVTHWINTDNVNYVMQLHDGTFQAVFDQSVLPIDDKDDGAGELLAIVKSSDGRPLMGPARQA